jgi:hypothetical protein
MPTPAVYTRVSSLSPVRDRSAGVRWLLAEPSAAIDGTRSARWMRYCARAASTLSVAMRRSRLLLSALAISACRSGSGKNSRQPISDAGTAEVLAATFS